MRGMYEQNKSEDRPHQRVPSSYLTLSFLDSEKREKGNTEKERHGTDQL